MAAAVGHEVLSLARTAVGPISDRDLRAGEWRQLTPDEVARLYQAAGSG